MSTHLQEERRNREQGRAIVTIYTAAAATYGEGRHHPFNCVAVVGSGLIIMLMPHARGAVSPEYSERVLCPVTV